MSPLLPCLCHHADFSPHPSPSSNLPFRYSLRIIRSLSAVSQPSTSDKRFSLSLTLPIYREKWPAAPAVSCAPSAATEFFVKAAASLARVDCVRLSTLAFRVSTSPLLSCLCHHANYALRPIPSSNLPTLSPFSVALILLLRLFPCSPNLPPRISTPFRATGRNDTMPSFLASIRITRQKFSSSAQHPHARRRFRCRVRDRRQVLTIILTPGTFRTRRRFRVP
ncbi:hypothetical protein B0H16DRAFT_43746 [Mycena metata]|uniref:Uncharacterized protein n=1 Tax=Mycena metata TaxID=1033252 RepID=A0AAD7JZZ9_9AGAR|nr:hypothetical protein B0H16DRAFT_43746 [Mycena metata]